MAQPLMPEEQLPQEPRNPPRTVVGVKGVDLILVRYTDERGALVTSLAVVGDNTVHMLDAKLFGLGRYPTAQGPANDWLKNGIFEKLGRKRS